MYVEGSFNASGDSVTVDKKKREPDMIQLKGNKIPPHLISLENMFDRHDAYIKRERDKKGKTCGEYDGINIGTNISPKMINIGKYCIQEERIEIQKLLIRFQDVFSWSYKDIKNFMGGKFIHEIPLKLEETPFRNKETITL